MASVKDRRLAKRARSIAGQARAVAEMAERGDSDDTLLTQLLAMRAAANSALSHFARARLTAELKRQLRQKLRKCPGACDYCDEILALLDDLDLDRALKRLRLAG